MKNDLAVSVGRFCLGLEAYRRTPEGRVRNERDLLLHFFPHDAKSARDEVFRHLPKEVRAPILTGWKIRGPKTALLDDDAKVAKVVHDAVVAGDVDGAAFESALSPEVLLTWVPLPSWWSFWRAGALSERAILRALSSAFDLGLFDAGWFLGTLEMAPPAGTSGPPKKGIDVLAEGLSKAELTEWMREIHRGGDGSPRGLIGALGWERIVRHTRAPLLIAVLDRCAQMIGLGASPGAATASAGASATPAASSTTSTTSTTPPPPTIPP